MKAVAEREAIGTLFDSAWGSTTPIAWPNAKFDPPEGGYWVRLAIIQGDAKQVEIGGVRNTSRATGAVIVSVFAPLGSGDAQARAYADQAAAIFDGQAVSFTDGRVLFRKAQTRDVGSSGSYHQVNVIVPYQLDAL